MNPTNKKWNIPLSMIKTNDWQSLISASNYGPNSGILSIILILTADDDGKGKVIPADIKLEFFTSQKWNEYSIKEMFENIHKLSNDIAFYRQNKSIFYQVNNWKKIQTIKSDRYKKSTFPILTKNNKICQKTNLFNKQIESNQEQINEQIESNQTQPTQLRPEQIGSRPYNKDNPAFIKGPNEQRMRLC